MKKVVGYVLAIAGLVLMISGLGVFSLGFLSGISSTYITIAGVVLVVLGVLQLRGKSARQKTVEVPIYEGKGNKRKVVGYQRE